MSTQIAIEQVSVVLRRAASNPNMTDMEPGSHHYKATLRYRGRQLTVPFSTGSGWTEEPTAKDVLDCLVSDTIGYESAGDFGEWCDEYGYNSDSRKALRTFRTVARLAAKVRAFLGDDFDAIAEAIQD